MMRFTTIEPAVFIEAIRAGDEAGVRQMIRMGADVNAKDFGGETPLMIAAIKGNKEIVQLLLLTGADAKYKPDEETSILALAEMYGHTNVADMLRNAGASD